MVHTATLPALVAAGCTRSKFEHVDDGGAYPLRQVLRVIVARGRHDLLRRHDWGRLAVCSAPIFDYLAYEPFWVQSLGFTISDTIPESLSVMQLAVKLRAERSDAHTEWERRLLAEWVEVQEVGELTQLIIPCLGDSQQEQLLAATQSSPTDSEVEVEVVELR